MVRTQSNDFTVWAIFFKLLSIIHNPNCIFWKYSVNNSGATFNGKHIYQLPPCWFSFCVGQDEITWDDIELGWVVFLYKDGMSGLGMKFARDEIIWDEIGLGWAVSLFNDGMKWLGMERLGMRWLGMKFFGMKWLGLDILGMNRLYTEE